MFPALGTLAKKTRGYARRSLSFVSSFLYNWLDTVDNEDGFILVLEYADYENVYDRFIFRTDANVTALSIPEELAPRLEESQEQCRQRKSFTLEVYALVDGREKFITGMAWESECRLIELPSATP